MAKILRSLILEKFPYELRVELELLSRRRDIQNEEKQQELILLLRKYDIDNIVPLGSGTNRYAFKLSGFVVKFATDRDGKIDNLKEYKMSKILQPYVIMVHDVSKNGTIQISEYIQPFDSYNEMCKHQEAIKTILGEISSMYLIGDVGIDPKNYSNWGRRLGTRRTPVCLDFAYIYEVSSSLFVCHFCNTDSMLHYYQDYSLLRCSNPSCRSVFKFEDIRSKIGSDMHNHEIGDLSKEGYVLTESKVLTELTPERSNYLMKRKQKKVKSEIVEEDTGEVVQEFIPELLSNLYLKEEIMMGGNTMYHQVVKDLKGQIQVPKPVVVAAAAVTPGPQNTGGFTQTFPVVADKQQPSRAVFQQSIRSAPIPAPVVPAASVVVEAVMVANPVSESKPDIPPQPTKLPSVEQLGASVSKIANCIKTYINTNDLYLMCKEHIRGTRVNEEIFYKSVQNSVYHTLMDFVGMIQDDGSRKYSPPEVSDDMDSIPTIRFMERIAHDGKIAYERNALQLMSRYRKRFNDFDGIEREWLVVLRGRIKTKISDINATGLDTIIDFISKEWCCSVVEEPEPVEPVTETTVIQSPVEDETEDESSDEDGAVESSEEQHGIEVDFVNYDDGWDIVTIRPRCGRYAIPFYVSLKEIEIDDSIPSLVDDRNETWDWLIHFEPDWLMVTTEPEKYMITNFEDDVEDAKSVIMEVQKDGKYVIGVYYVSPSLGSLSKDNENLRIINYLVKQNLAHTPVSQLMRSLMRDDLFEDENDILNHIGLGPNTTESSEESYDNDEDGDGENVVSDESLAEIAAAEALQNLATPPSAQVEESETDDDMESFVFPARRFRNQ